LLTLRWTFPAKRASVVATDSKPDGCAPLPRQRLVGLRGVCVVVARCFAGAIERSVSMSKRKRGRTAKARSSSKVRPKAARSSREPSIGGPRLLPTRCPDHLPSRCASLNAVRGARGRTMLGRAAEPPTNQHAEVRIPPPQPRSRVSVNLGRFCLPFTGAKKASARSCRELMPRRLYSICCRITGRRLTPPEACSASRRLHGRPFPSSWVRCPIR
jgi:hypothetical protein